MMRLGDLLHGLGFDMVAIARDSSMSPDQIEELLDLDANSEVGLTCHYLGRVAFYASHFNGTLYKRLLASVLAMAWPKQLEPKAGDGSNLEWDQLAWEAMAVFLYG